MIGTPGRQVVLGVLLHPGHGMDALEQQRDLHGLPLRLFTSGQEAQRYSQTRMSDSSWSMSTGFVT